MAIDTASRRAFHHVFTWFVVLITIACASACSGGGSAPICPALKTVSADTLQSEMVGGLIEPLCAPARIGQAHCLAYRLTKKGRHAYAGQYRTLQATIPTNEGGCPTGAPTPQAVPQPSASAALVCVNPDSSTLGPSNLCLPAPGSSPQASPSGGCAASLPGDSQGPYGYSPYDLQSAYGLLCLSPSGGSGKVVAMVESGDAPTLEHDLGVYRAQYGLPACTKANGCLRVTAQDGSAMLPPYDPNWAGEGIIDVQMVSAICPNCHLLIVEAQDENQGLLIGVNMAVQLGASVVSASWGGAPEDPTEASFFAHPGVPITAASGDTGFEDGRFSVESPSDLSTVISVGGTSLRRSATARGWSETVWSGSGSGCSRIIPKPSWQTDTACSMRTLNDVAFVADPLTGIAVYDSNPSDGPPGWEIAGGTSIAAPAIASIYALVGAHVNDASSLYAAAGTSAFNDVAQGANGICTPSLLCKAGVGYDGPTGNGTPNGAAAF